MMYKTKSFSAMPLSSSHFLVCLGVCVCVCLVVCACVYVCA